MTINNKALFIENLKSSFGFAQIAVHPWNGVQELETGVDHRALDLP
jgi:hypothetical protein